MIVKKIAQMMEMATGQKPKRWGDSIVGFGLRHFKYESGRELDWMEIGFSPRKQNLTFYLINEESPGPDLLGKLGKQKMGKDCLYFKSLSQINEKILEKIIEKAVKTIRKQ